MKLLPIILILVGCGTMRHETLMPVSGGMRCPHGTVYAIDGEEPVEIEYRPTEAMVHFWRRAFKREKKNDL